MIGWIVIGGLAFVVVVGASSRWKAKREEAALQKRSGGVSYPGLNLQVHLSYRDASGVSTERRVTIHELHGHRRSKRPFRPEAFQAYCHLRKAARIFRLDRVEQAADKDGVIIDDLGAWIMKAAKLD